MNYHQRLINSLGCKVFIEFTGVSRVQTLLGDTRKVTPLQLFPNLVAPGRAAYTLARHGPAQPDLETAVTIVERQVLVIVHLRNVTVHLIQYDATRAPRYSLRLVDRLTVGVFRVANLAHKGLTLQVAR